MEKGRCYTLTLIPERIWLLPKDKSGKRQILSINSAQALEARVSCYRPRYHSMLLFNSLQKDRVFFQNIGHWMQTSTGRVWMDYIHFQNPWTDVSYLIKGKIHFKQFRLFMFPLVFSPWVLRKQFKLNAFKNVNTECFNLYLQNVMNSKGIYYQEANTSFQKNVNVSTQIMFFDEQSIKIPFAPHSYFMIYSSLLLH